MKPLSPSYSAKRRRRKLVCPLCKEQDVAVTFGHTRGGFKMLAMHFEAHHPGYVFEQQ
jgi:hypothetical protein